MLEGSALVKPRLLPTRVYTLANAFIVHFAVSSLNFEGELLLRTSFGIHFHDKIAAGISRLDLHWNAASRLLAVSCYSSVSWLLLIKSLENTHVYSCFI